MVLAKAGHCWRSDSRREGRGRGAAEAGERPARGCQGPGTALLSQATWEGSGGPTPGLCVHRPGGVRPRPWVMAREGQEAACPRGPLRFH